MKVINIVGARPNFMKIAPIIEAMNLYATQFEHLLVHTGQHYDEKMSKSFFLDLEMPRPDINLEVGSGSHAEQTARIMVAFEKVCLEHRPDLIIVVGDVNSTLACTITAKKLGIKVAHVEAGLRSRDMTMPEEINRLCTDVLSDYLFTTDRIADENLRKEGIPNERIFFVGNVMIDTLLRHRVKAAQLSLMKDWGIEPGGFLTLTLHRPSNVDDPRVFTGILDSLTEISANHPIIFPVHPRTWKMIVRFGLEHYFSHNLPVRGIWITDPLGYLEFLHLNIHARLVLTDSGGLQEETTVLGVPCITLRNNTERPVTCVEGTNQLVGNNPTTILDAVNNVLSGNMIKGKIPKFWDGHAAERIIHVLGA